MKKPAFLDGIEKAAAPTAEQIKKAGEGILRKNGNRDKPQFVALFHHTISQTSAFYCIMCMVAAIFLVPFTLQLFVRTTMAITRGGAQDLLTNGTLEVTILVFGIELALLCLMIAGLIVLSRRILLSNHHHRLGLCEALLLVDTFIIMCHLMLFGINAPLLLYGLLAALLIALHSFWDPELAQERANRSIEQESLHDMIHSSVDERTVVRGKKAGKGYISLNFFNLFWIFTICCVLGLLIETIYYMATHGGTYMDRAGMLWGPLSPIYGFGGALMTIALNRLHNKNVVVIFLISAVIGGAFEYFTSWFMQIAFGVTAWNYSGTFLSIGGRTDFFYMCCWGLLGVIWIKLLLPTMIYFIRKIPWGWRYTLTTICAMLMIFDGVATLTTLDCWYMREAGIPQTTPIEKYCALHYDNKYMQDRFQTMTMNVDNTIRTKSMDEEGR